MIDKIMESYPDETFLKMDGFDEAIIGKDINSNKLIYSFTKCIQILIKDMVEEEALDYFYFNIVGSYVGENTPIIVEDSF
jgi:hypothetical protein